MDCGILTLVLVYHDRWPRLMMVLTVSLVVLLNKLEFMFSATNERNTSFLLKII